MPFVAVRGKPPIDPGDFGLIADGSSHPLSSRYGTLTEAQADYPFASDLQQEIDYCACQLASNIAFGEAGNEHGTQAHLNRRIHLPAGSYRFGNDTWVIRNLSSGVIEGDGRLVTVLRGNRTLLAFDGIWYSRLSDFSVQCMTPDGIAALEIDGNIPGHPYPTRGVQGVTLADMLIDGGGSLYAFVFNRLGGSSAQGDQCNFMNVHLSNASFALYYQNGYNSLNNTFIGGNFQNYRKYGAYILGGTFGFINTSFQSTVGYRQIENDGWDIRCGDAGAFEGCLVYGCRTESLRFLHNAGAVRVDVRACVGNPAFPRWFANTSYGASAAQYKAVLVKGRLFEATTEGISGAIEPDWDSVAEGGTISDNTIVWTHIPFVAIENLLGAIDRDTTAMRGGGAVHAVPKTRLVTVTSDYRVQDAIDIVVCDATNQPITVVFPSVSGIERGRAITVTKADTSLNEVTITLQHGLAIGGTEYTLAGGARSTVTLVFADGVGGVRRWHIIGSSTS